MDNYENFTNERQQLAQSWSEREYNRRDELREKKKPWVRALEKIALWTVIVAIGLYLCYAILLHPADKIKLCAAIFQNYTITVSAGWGSRTIDMKLDKDVIYYDNTYYLIEDGKVFEYNYWGNSWVKHLSSDFDDAIMDSEETLKLLDSRNYERVEGKLFEWKLKEEIEIDGLKSVYLKYDNGRIVFVCYVNSISSFIMEFHHVGTTDVDRPWEEE